jgi:plastocyanin
MRWLRAGVADGEGRGYRGLGQQGSVSHTATSKAGRFDSGEIAAGGSWKIVAKRKGEFSYVCSLHPTMKGTMRVE